MRLPLVAAAGFALALGLTFIFGLGVQAVRRKDPPVECPQTSMAARFDGHIAGLAHVDERGATFSGSVPGASTPGPEPLTELTVVQGDQLYRIEHFTRTPDPPNRYLIFIHDAALETKDPTVFVTSACIPDHPILLKSWTYSYDTRRRADDPKEVQLVAYLRDHVTTEQLYKLDPRILVHTTTKIPGCERVGVLGDSITRDALVAALVCLGPADAVIRTALAPIPGAEIREFATLDIDGDGVEELLVVLNQPIHRDSVNLSLRLLQHDPATDQFTTVELGRPT